MGNFCSGYRVNEEEKEDYNSIPYSEYIFQGIKISLIQGYIYLEEVDCLVNVIDQIYNFNSGSSKYLIKNGGKIIEKEFLEATKNKRKESVPKFTQTIETSGGKLKIKKILHVKVPGWSAGEFEDERKLKQCVKNSLEMANNLKSKTIAIPSFSTEIIGFPKHVCAEIMIKSLMEFIVKNKTRLLIEEIRIVNRDRLSSKFLDIEMFKVFEKIKYRSETF